MNGLLLGVALCSAAQVDRLDLGVRLQSFEKAYLKAVGEKKLSDSEITEIDRDFDRLSVQFFAGNGGAAITELDRMTRRLARVANPVEAIPLESDDATGSKLLAVPSLIVVDGPVVLWPERSAELRYRIQGVQDFEGEESLDVSMTVALHARVPRNIAKDSDDGGPHEHVKYNGAEGCSKSTLEPFSNFDAWIDLTWSEAPTITDVGEWRLALRSLASNEAEGDSDSIRGFIELARVHFVRDDPDATSASLQERLTKLSERTDLAPDLPRAIAICRDRCGKLKSKWNGSDTFPVADDLELLRKHLCGEVDALESGTNPYRSMGGNHWKTLRIGDSKALPYRVTAPFDVGKVGKLPLVIAFHGMGGDENMFFSAYGAGRLRGLAESKKFLCVTPLTYDYLAKPDRIATLIEEIERDYEIDRDRIHVLGHSMGASVALSIAQKQRDLIASAAAFAGAGNRSEPIVPTLLFAGTNDGIVPFAGVERFANSPAVKDAIEFQPLAGRGHTLLVGDHLEEAIDFVLAHPKKKP